MRIDQGTILVDENGFVFELGQSFSISIPGRGVEGIRGSRQDRRQIKQKDQGCRGLFVIAWFLGSVDNSIVT